jgi:flavin reductase (DIM6/NTAB) family NADH-FMN oxidoreductase RutF
MEKIQISNDVSWPGSIAVIAVMVNGKPNFSTVAWFTRVSSDPPAIGLSLDPEHLTSQTILKNKCFSVNFPPPELMVETDYVGIYSGKNTNKSDVFKVYYKTNEQVPLIQDCLVSMSCKLINTVNINGDVFFIANIEEVFAKEEIVKGNKVDLGKAGTIIYADKMYYRLGEVLGLAWTVGMKNTDY